MISLRTVAFALIVAGVLALAYGGFSYPRETHHATLGSLELSVNERETVNIPMWAGIGALVVGGALLLNGAKRG